MLAVIAVSRAAAQVVSYRTHWVIVAALTTVTILQSQTVGSGPLPSPEQRSTYVLGPEDQILIRALHCEEISDKPYRVQPDGYLNLPLVGSVKVSGLDVTALEASLRDLLRKYYIDPQVTVTVSEFRSQPVSVVGAVANPGVQQLQGRKTLLEIISMAGGTKPDAGPVVKITRELQWGRIPLASAHDDGSGKFSVAEVRLSGLIESRNPEENILIRPNDVISIPQSPLIYVLGEVKKSGGFVMGSRTSMTVLEALSMAEGLQVRAAPGKARILRSTGETERKEEPINVSRILSGKDKDVALHPSDILFIPNSTAKSVTTRSLEAAIQIGTGLVIWR
ncbi:MAG TPA: polysaccharide biosynthesis/export family protein [Bryobacteraceae bacterium]|nr:polysaccharide biosynthesis/export family protein [Bryobacteraceae bacterium]